MLARQTDRQTDRQTRDSTVPGRGKDYSAAITSDAPHSCPRRIIVPWRERRQVVALIRHPSRNSFRECNGKGSRMEQRAKRKTLKNDRR